MASHVLNVTLKDIKGLTCSKCGKERTAEHCVCEDPPVKSEAPIQIVYDRIEYNIPDHWRIVKKILESKIDGIEIKATEKLLTLKGLREKWAILKGWGMSIDETITIDINEDNLERLKEISTNIETFKDKAIYGYKRYNISALKFIISEAYRNKYFQSDFNRWKPEAHYIQERILNLVEKCIIGSVSVGIYALADYASKHA